MLVPVHSTRPVAVGPECCEPLVKVGVLVLLRYPAPFTPSRKEASKPITGVCLRTSRRLPGPPTLDLYDERPTQKSADHY
jgi:hypothetical protein